MTTIPNAASQTACVKKQTFSSTRLSFTSGVEE